MVMQKSDAVSKSTRSITPRTETESKRERETESETERETERGEYLFAQVPVMSNMCEYQRLG